MRGNEGLAVAFILSDAPEPAAIDSAALFARRSLGRTA
jgi:hypothetical protein